MKANNNGQADTISLTRDINLTDGALPAFRPDHGQAVTLLGNGFTLDRTGPARFRILHNKGARLLIRDLTVTHGVASDEGGGGIFNQSGHLSLRRVKLDRNEAVGTTVGGGLYNETGAILDINECTFTRNHSATFGGGMRNQGFVSFIRNSTYAYNVAATDGGGGICNFFGGGINLVENCTFTGNTAVRGGGICNHTSVSLVNCTFVGNGAQLTGGGIENDNVIPNLVNSIIADNSGGQVFPHTPLFATNNVITQGVPVVGPLRNNGGPTKTMALLPGSPAIGTGTTVGAPPRDQRGFPRPVGGPIDIGAFQSSGGRQFRQRRL